MIVHNFEAKRDALIITNSIEIYTCVCCNNLIQTDKYDMLFCSEKCLMEYEEFGESFSY
jgi:predicted nucleic acid-binding Zn ribbon protein